MTKQTRHHAGRAQTSGPDAGLPAPGQALIGYPEPQSSLFGVPLPTTSLFGVPQQAAKPDGAATWAPAPPRPRTPQDDYRRTRPQVPPVPAPRRRRQHWPRLLGFPLAVLVLGVALGVIAVVMLLAAGVPAPWATRSGPAVAGPSTMPGQSTRPAAQVPSNPRVATEIAQKGTYLVGSQLRAGRYQSEGGVSCYWARLRDVAGVPTVVAEGNGTGPTTVWIRKADSAFRTSGCAVWTRR